MTTQIPLTPYGYTGRSLSRVQNGVVMYRGDTVNRDTHTGEDWPSKGYQITRQVGDSHSKPCASWNHFHTDGGQITVIYYDTALYPETGSDNPSSIASGLTQTWTPVFVNKPTPEGMSVFFNGTDSEAKLIREDGSNALETVPFSFEAPSGATATPQTSGGSLADATYYVMVTAVDQDGGVTVETAPQVIGAVTVTGGGGSGSIDVDISSWTESSGRATHWRVYLATENVNSSHILAATTVVGTTSYTVTAIPSAANGSISNINETIRQAHLPLTSVTCAWLHGERLWIGSDTQNKVYFSERNNINHWYSVNFEDRLNGGVIGGISANNSCYAFTTEGITRIYGDFSRDLEGDNPTFILDIGVANIPTSRRLVGPNAVTRSTSSPGVSDATIFFQAHDGLAYITANATSLVVPDDQHGMFRRLDPAYATRTVLAEDPAGYICVLAARCTNSTRPLDGASVAGVPDRIYRFDYRHNIWTAPLAVGDISHIIRRTNESAGVTLGAPKLMAASVTGRVLQLGYGWSGGNPATIDDVEYNGQASTAETTTTVSYLESGVSADDYNGMTVTLKYPDDDDNYPGFTALRTVTDTAVSGSTVTLTWQGALTVPTGSAASDIWTVRVGGMLGICDVAASLDAMGTPPEELQKLISARLLFNHVIGVEADG